jgi:hypothetical protein
MSDRLRLYIYPDGTSSTETGPSPARRVSQHNLARAALVIDLENAGPTNLGGPVRCSIRKDRSGRRLEVGKAPRPAGGELFTAVDSARLLVIDPSYLGPEAEAIAHEYAARGLAVFIDTDADGLYPVETHPEGVLIRPGKWTTHMSPRPTEGHMYRLISEAAMSPDTEELTDTELAELVKAKLEEVGYRLGPIIPAELAELVEHKLEEMGYRLEVVRCPHPADPKASHRLVTALERDPLAPLPDVVNVPGNLAPYVNAAIRWAGGEVWE